MTEVGVAITLHHCTQTPCESANDSLGSVLYTGPFNPQRSSPTTQPVQGFPVVIPTSFESGPAVFSVVHASLVGVSSCSSVVQRGSDSFDFFKCQAGPNFVSEIVNVDVIIA